MVSVRLFFMRVSVINCFKACGWLAPSGGTTEVQTKMWQWELRKPAVCSECSTVWRSTTYSNNTKLRIFNTNVKSALLYGCETWRLTKTIIHQLQVLVNRCILRTLNIFWPVQISNQELWTRAKQKTIELEIRQRKWGWLGHTLPTTRRHSKNSYRMESSRNQIPRQTPNNMVQNNPWRNQTSRQNMEWSQSTRQKPCQMDKLCEGPMFPWGMMGNYYYYYYY